MKFQEYQGNLLEVEVDVIAHQCNCTGQGAAGLAYYVFERYPEVNDYLDNPKPMRFTTVSLRETVDGTCKAVANMWTQFWPGGPQVAPSLDDESMRLIAFERALSLLAEEMGQRNYTSVAFPCRYGSDLAGGDWATYRAMIQKFARTHPYLDVHIVELVRNTKAVTAKN